MLLAQLSEVNHAFSLILFCSLCVCVSVCVCLCVCLILAAFLSLFSCFLVFLFSCFLGFVCGGGALSSSSAGWESRQRT